MSRARVAVVSTTPETILEDVERALALAADGVLHDRSRPILLGLQLGWNRPFPGVSTPPWQLDGVLRALERAHLGPDRLLATARPERGVDARRALEANLLDAVLRRQGLSFREVSELPRRRLTLRGPFLRWSGLHAHELDVPESLVDSTVLLLPTLTTHADLQIAGAVHALASLLLGDLPVVPVDHLHELLVDVLAVRRELGVECVVLVDGTVCGDGAGPRTPRPSLQNVLVASRDPLALDVVAASMMGFDPRQVPYVRMATELGLGRGRVEEIEVMGEEVRGVDFGFRARRNPAAWGAALRGGPFRQWLERVARRASADALYREWMWYPWVGRSLVRRYRRTNWGRLFDHYRATGSKP